VTLTRNEPHAAVVDGRVVQRTPAAESAAVGNIGRPVTSVLVPRHRCRCARCFADDLPNTAPSPQQWRRKRSCSRPHSHSAPRAHRQPMSVRRRSLTHHVKVEHHVVAHYHL
jgi:hypothetical protein